MGTRGFVCATLILLLGVVLGRLVEVGLGVDSIAFAFAFAAASETGATTKISWNGKSKAMFDNVIKTSPFFVRSKVESRMRDEIKNRKLSVVTEKELYSVVHKVTPKLFLGGTLDAMKKA